MPNPVGKEGIGLAFGWVLARLRQEVNHMTTAPKPTSATLSQNENGTAVLIVYLSDGTTHTLVGAQAISMASKLREMGIPVNDLGRVGQKIKDKRQQENDSEDNSGDNHPPSRPKP